MIDVNRPLLLLDSESFDAVCDGKYRIERIPLEDVRELINIFGEIDGVMKCYSDCGIDVILDKCRWSLPSCETSDIEYVDSAIIFKKNKDSFSPDPYSFRIVTRVEDLNLSDIAN